MFIATAVVTIWYHCYTCYYFLSFLLLWEIVLVSVTSGDTWTLWITIMCMRRNFLPRTNPPIPTMALACWHRSVLEAYPWTHQGQPTSLDTPVQHPQEAGCSRCFHGENFFSRRCKHLPLNQVLGLISTGKKYEAHILGGKSGSSLFGQNYQPLSFVVCGTSAISPKPEGMEKITESWWEQLTQQRSGHQTRIRHFIRQPRFHVPKMDQYGQNSSNLRFYVFIDSWNSGLNSYPKKKHGHRSSNSIHKRIRWSSPTNFRCWSTPQSSHLSRRQRASCAAVACAISRSAPHFVRRKNVKNDGRQNITAIPWRLNHLHWKMGKINWHGTFIEHSHGHVRTPV